MLNTHLTHIDVRKSLKFHEVLVVVAFEDGDEVLRNVVKEVEL